LVDVPSEILDWTRPLTSAFDVIPEIVPTTFGVAMVIGTVCNVLVAVTAEEKEMSPLHFPSRSKEYPTGRDKFTVPVSFIWTHNPNLSDVPIVEDFTLIDPLEQASGLETSTLKFAAANEKFFVIAVLVTVKESVPDRYPEPVDPNWAQILTSEPLASPKLIL
jgi:hypothetical protein